MKKFLKTMTMSALTGGLLCLGVPAGAQEEEPQQQQQQEEMAEAPQQQKGQQQQGQMQRGVEKSRQVTTTAEVVDIDKENRTLILEGPKGKTFSVQAGDKVQGFDQIKQGDRVRVKYNESLALSLRQPGEEPKAEEETQIKELQQGAEMGREMEATVEVVEVDKKNNKITLEGPEGRTWTMQVTQPDMQAKLGQLKKGDQIDAKYTENLAVSIEKA